MLHRNLSLLAAACLTLASCCGGNAPHTLIVNSKDALVKTQQGTVSGYIEDGIYTFSAGTY